MTPREAPPHDMLSRAWVQTDALSIRPQTNRHSIEDRLHPTPGANTCVERVHGVTVVRIDGVIDLSSAPTVARRLHSVLTDVPCAVVIDLTDVSFLAAAGLDVLVNARLEAAPTVHMAVVAGHRAVSRPMELTGVDQIVPLYVEAAEAIRAMRLAAGVEAERSPPRNR